MKQIIASVFFDILSYTIGNIIIWIIQNLGYTNFGMPKLTSFLVLIKLQLRQILYLKDRGGILKYRHSKLIAR